VPRIPDEKVQRKFASAMLRFGSSRWTLSKSDKRFLAGREGDFNLELGHGT